MTDVLVTVDAGPGADSAEITELTLLLRDELVEHELDAVLLPSPAPPGTKGFGSGDITSILVVLATSGGVLTTMVGVLQAWLVRNSGSQVELEVGGERIVLTPTTEDERKRMLDVFLARHEASGPKEEGRGGHLPK
jgi:hypothetical protein